MGVGGADEKKDPALSQSLRDGIHMAGSDIDEINKEAESQSLQDATFNMAGENDAEENKEDALSQPSQDSIYFNDEEMNKDAALSQSSQDSIHINENEKSEGVVLSQSLQNIFHMAGNDTNDNRKDALLQYSHDAFYISVGRNANENKDVSLSQSSEDYIHMAIISHTDDKEEPVKSIRDVNISSSKNFIDDVNRKMHPNVMRVSDTSVNFHLSLPSHDTNGVDSMPLRQNTYCSIESGVCMNDRKLQSNIAGLDGQGSAPSWLSNETSTCRSTSSHGSSCSNSDEEEDGDCNDDDDAVEDWETVADALNIQEPLHENNNPDGNPPENKQIDERSTELWRNDMEKCVLKPQGKFRPENSGYRMRADASRAWRPDDMSRPLTLPCLKKQNSFPMQSGSTVWGNSRGSVWGIPPPPSHCPICTEELDTTDSSFLPCPCGFRLCLFCHHKIIINDARCPGCRKSYNLEETLKLSRSASLRTRLPN